MVDRSCRYIRVLPWENGGDGADYYCMVSRRSLEGCGDEAPSEPFCDSDSAYFCFWARRQDFLDGERTTDSKTLDLNSGAKLNGS